MILLGIAESVIADERDRGRALDSKTGSLAAFSGAILAIDVALGQGLVDRDLGQVGTPIVAISFLVAALGLAAAAGFAVWGVLRPQAFLALKRSQVESFARYPLIAAEPGTIRGSMLLTIADNLLPRERARNDRKVMSVKVAATCLLVGLAGVAAQALTLGVHELAWS